MRRIIHSRGPLVIYFRRRTFYGPDRHTDPKWHITAEFPAENGQAVALCGYSQPHYRGRLLTSRTTNSKPTASVCAKCAAKLDTATPSS